MAQDAELMERPKTKPTVAVCYVPQNDDDRPRTRVGSIVFLANVPVELNRGNPQHYVEQLLGVRGETSDGATIIKHSPKKVFLGDVLKENPSFTIDGVAPAGARRDRAGVKPRMPTDDRTYRGHAMAMINNSESTAALSQWWESERDLREKCGVTDEDVAFLRPFLEARFAVLKGAIFEGSEA